MAEIAIGYNISKAKDLAEDVETKYKELKGTIVDNWQTVQSTLQQEWIGEDEVSFEATLAKRINTLYQNASNLASNCCQVIGELTDDWISFQRGNVLDGGAAAGAAAGIAGMVNSVIEQIQSFISQIFGAGTEEIVKAKPEELNENTDRGLKTQNSATTIQGKVSEYVNAVKTKAQSLFDGIKSNTAFFGEQSGKIDSFISSTGTAIGEVSSALKDLNEALAKLAGTAYTQAQSSITEAVGTAETNVNKSVDDLGETRWS